jgi:hypothetical protein
VLTEAYLERVSAPLEIGPELLARWQAVQAAARMAEGVPRGALFEVWRQYEPVVQAAAN